MTSAVVVAGCVQSASAIGGERADLRRVLQVRTRFLLSEYSCAASWKSWGSQSGSHSFATHSATAR